MPKLLTEAELLVQPDEEYMSPAQLAFFRARLLVERAEVANRISIGAQQLRDETESERISDEADLASREEARRWNMRQMDRDRKLIHKLDQAISRIDSGDYGWCEETGDPIGLKRLLLRPATTLSADFGAS